MMRRIFFAICVVFASAWSCAQDADAKELFRGKVVLIAGFEEGSKVAASVRKFAASYSDSNSDTFLFASKTRPGPDRFRVLNHYGKIVYEGGDDREAESAVVNAITDMPNPGHLSRGRRSKRDRNRNKKKKDLKEKKKNGI